MTLTCFLLSSSQSCFFHWFRSLVLMADVSRHKQTAECSEERSVAPAAPLNGRYGVETIHTLSYTVIPNFNFLYI